MSRIPLLLFGLALVLLPACGGGSGGGAALPAATAVIHFPTPASTTEKTSVLVRGAAENAVAVQVNGVVATSSDGFATWEALVPLSSGANALQVDAQNAQGVWTTDAASAAIQGQRVAFTYADDMAFDPTSQIAWVLDTDRDAVIRVDVTSGERALLSGDGAPDVVNPFADVRAIVYDAARTRLLVVSSLALTAVDLVTGARTILSDATTPDAVNMWSSGRYLAMDTINDRVLVLSTGGDDTIYAVHPVTGARSILSSPTVPDATNSLDGAGCMTFDAAGSRVLVGNSSTRAILAVNLTTGTRTVVSDDATPDATNSLSGPTDIAVDAANGRALVLNRGFRGSKQVLAVDFTTGARTVFADTDTVNGHVLDRPESLQMDAGNNRVLTFNTLTSELLAIDLTTAFVTELASIHTPDENQPAFEPYGIEIDLETNQLYVSDNLSNAVFRVDAATGARTLLSGPGVPDDINPMSNLYDLALDKPNNRLLVVSRGQDQIIAVDLTTGARTVFAEPSGQTPISSPYSIVIDADRNRALVGDAAFDGLIAFDLTTGVGTFFSTPGVPDNVDNLSGATALTLDLPNHRVLVGDDGVGVVAVDLTTGARTILVPGVLDEPNGHMVYDAATDRLFVADYDQYGIVVIDLTAQTLDDWSNENAPYYENNAWEPYGIVEDPVRGIYYATDASSGAIVVMDARNGERVVLTR